MNCANHADASAVAYCRTCGKALCANCTRPVRGVIYCEDCLGAKMEGVPAGTAGFVPGTFTPAGSGQVPPPPGAPGVSSGPNPTVAGILGAIPFGIGAVYNGQYGKGLAHLAIFAFLIYGSNHSGSWGDVVFGFAIAFFWFYQIFDAVRTAKAIQAGAPGPDPFGLAEIATGGTKIDASKIPTGAIVLIVVGVLFLLNTLGLEFGIDRYWPIILIGLGVWLFARNWGLVGGCCSGCQCARCRTRRVMGPAMLVTIGVLFLLDVTMHGPGFHQTWPVILLVVGVVKLLQSSASTEGHVPPGASVAGGVIPPAPPMPPAPPVPPVPPSSEVNHG
jgi:LiaI-LiaF-like transmembrane region/B-box zinc finger